MPRSSSSNPHPSIIHPFIHTSIAPTASSPHRRLNNLIIILPANRINHALRSIPQHHAAHIRHIGRRRFLDRRRHGVGSQVSGAGARGAGGGADVQLGAAGDVLAPGFEAVGEAGLADVAVAVVVELDPLICPEVSGFILLRFGGKGWVRDRLEWGKKETGRRGKRRYLRRNP